MTPDRLTLEGCSPTPLASYLKALAVLRLLSSGANSVTGKPADPYVRGWWQGERFHMRTTLGHDGLMEFFLHDYAPSPVIAPWNGGSGFYAKDNKDGIRPLEAEDVAERFRSYSIAIERAAKTLRHLELTARPQDRKAKERLVAMLRARLPASVLPWLDAAIVLSGDGLRFPQLLGTGGNDGRLDFTNNLMRRLVSEKKPLGIFDASSGEASPQGKKLLRNALFSTPVHELTGVAVGQFSPGGAGGPNATTGYEGNPTVNPWDYVFMLEGAMTFACAATRRYQSNALFRASFPFTVATSGAGWGGIESKDESDARAEFWAPLWTRQASFCELEALFGEGRAVTNGQTARDGLDFARALANLGVSRGLSEFQRYGFFKRAGNTHYAAALARRRAAPSLGAELIADLDHGSWLSQVRRFGRDGNQPASVRNAVKSLEDSLFDVLAPECSRRSVCAALKAVGRLGRWLSISPKGRESVRCPPPLLSRHWLRRANDGSPEFRVAAALAGLGIAPPTAQADADTDSGTAITHPPPMAAHFAPLTNGPREGFERNTFFRNQWLRKRRRWSDGDRPPTIVWSHSGLVTNLIAVLERRLVEKSIRGLMEKPLRGASIARLSDVVAFLMRDFDDARCADLLTGLIWARPTWIPAQTREPSVAAPTPVPFAYAALKPVFSTDKALFRVGAIPREGSLPIPSGLVGQLRAGGGSLDGRATHQAVCAAFARARSSGLPSPYDPVPSSGSVSSPISGRIGVGIRPDRLAAAMLIPVSDHGLASLLRRAYPGALPEIAHSSKGTPNVH